MDKQPVGQLPDLTQSNNDDEIMVITNDEYNQLKKEKISDFITDLTSTDAGNSLVKGDDGKLFVSKTINASDVDGVLSLDNIPQLTTNKLPETGISADNYTYPSSITVNDRGQVVSIVEGSAAEAGAYLDQSQITNCILEVPQRVNVELNSNHQLVLKAGSVVIVPYGTSAPTMEIGDTLNYGEIVDISWNGENLFYYVKYDEDLITTAYWANITQLGFVIKEGEISCGAYSERFFSGATVPSDLTGSINYWYDTENNIIKHHNGTSWTDDIVSLPFCLARNSSTTEALFASIDEVFNGFGFIGSTIWCDKGVKVLCSNGRNPDGTLNNTELELTSVETTTVDEARTNAKLVIFETKDIIWGGIYSYNPDLNCLEHPTVGNRSGCFIANFDSDDSGKITSFKPYNTFHAVDYNEAVKRSGDTMYGGLTIEDSQLTVKGAYPAYYGKNTNIAISDTTAPSSSQFFLQLRGDDMNGDWVGVNQYYQSTGNTFMGQNIIRRKVNNVYKECYFDLMITNNGTRTANVQSDNITHNGTTIRYVKEYYVNGTTWYRVWSDGFIEQSGRAVGFNTVTFPKKFTTVPNVVNTCITDEWCIGSPVNNITTSSFYVGNAIHGGVHENRPRLTNCWYACGH